MVRGYFVGALRRERSSGSHGVGSRGCKHDLGCVIESRGPGVTCQLFPACFETGETGKKKGVGVWHAISISTVVDNVDTSFLYGFYLVDLTVCE